MHHYDPDMTYTYVKTSVLMWKWSLKTGNFNQIGWSLVGNGRWSFNMHRYVKPISALESGLIRKVIFEHSGLPL